MRDRLGKYLRELRQQRGLTLTAVAEASGIDRMKIWRVEQGKSDIRLDALERLAKVYGLKASTIVRRVA